MSRFVNLHQQKLACWLQFLSNDICELIPQKFLTDFVSFLLQLHMNDSNSVVYFGLFEGHDPSPSKDPGYTIMSSFLIFYK